jgi:hypothetical protein
VAFSLVAAAAEDRLIFRRNVHLSFLRREGLQRVHSLLACV